MKKLKNKKRTIPKKVEKDHKCRFEYSAKHSTPECTVFICIEKKYCDVMIPEFEDAPAGG